jgi:hypothetical protein
LVQVLRASSASVTQQPPPNTFCRRFAKLIRRASAVNLELTVGMNDILVRALIEKNLGLVFGPP